MYSSSICYILFFHLYLSNFLLYKATILVL
nr:MAG TPA: hypothetical protein [Caudoviricetes sp.]